MEMSKTFSPANLEEWRLWLEEHHDRETEVWLIYFKKDSGRKSVTYNESVEEALCFGWIDSLIQKIDAEKYARKFSRRRKGSNWSELNKHRVAKLVQQWRMTPAGFAVVDFPLPRADAPPPVRPHPVMPDWLKNGLMASPLAWNHFNHLPPSHQHRYIGWILDAKLEQTRQRRIREAIRRLERNERLGIKQSSLR